MGHFIQHSYPFYITSIYLQGENNIIIFQYLWTALIIKSIFNPIQIQGFNQTKPVSHPLKTEILAGARAKQTERLLPITSCEACIFLVAISSFDLNVFKFWTASQTNFKMLRWIKGIGFLTSRPATRLQCNLFLFNCLESLIFFFSIKAILSPRKVPFFRIKLVVQKVSDRLVRCVWWTVKPGAKSWQSSPMTWAKCVEPYCATWVIRCGTEMVKNMRRSLPLLYDFMVVFWSEMNWTVSRKPICFVGMNWSVYQLEIHALWIPLQQDVDSFKPKVCLGCFQPDMFTQFSERQRNAWAMSLGSQGWRRCIKMDPPGKSPNWLPDAKHLDKGRVHQRCCNNGLPFSQPWGVLAWWKEHHLPALFVLSAGFCQVEGLSFHH